MRVQIFLICENFTSIKCYDFDTELHFAGVKLREEKTKLSNQIKMTLSRLEISVILRVQNFANFGQFHEIHEILYLRNLIPLIYYCQPNVQYTLLHKDFNCPV